jgi:eukaryotic-like serine/threonine-protein kinase
MIGQQVSHYEIISRLGTGGMGEVYEGRDHRLGRRVALKFLPRELSRDARAVERLQHEARIASSLNHPHICTIHDIDSHHGTHFIVMELLDGMALKQRIASGPLPIRELIDIAGQVADALGAAHRLGIVHRDVKPANIFLTSHGVVKVLDFGLAKIQHQAPQAAAFMASAGAARPRSSYGNDFDGVGAMVLPPSPLTSGGVAFGTVQYMSPEQARGHELDARSDLFSLGAVIYEMATGRQAFVGATVVSICDAIVHSDPAPASNVNGGVPPDLDQIIARLLHKDRAARYQAAEDLMRDLVSVQRELSGEVPIGRTAEHSHYRTVTTRQNVTPPAQDRPPPTTPRWMLYLATGVVVLATLGAVTAFWTTRWSHPLTERDTIVVGDFNNTTADGVFDEALRQAASVQLQQSPWLSILSDQRAAGFLRLMGRPPETRIAGAVARELCTRAGAQAVLEGSIATIASTYLITLDAQECSTGDSLAREQAQADGKDAVLKQLGTATSRLRARLGESLASVQKYDTPIQEATTTSLSALRAYSLGVRARIREGDSAAIPFFRQAIEQDSGFALAHARLSVVYENLGDRQLARDEVQKAFDLREKVGEYERQYITTRYHDIVTGDAQKRIDTLRLMSDTFPRDFAPRNNLGVVYLEMGRLDQALEQFRAAVTLAPDQRLPNMNLANTLVAVGQIDEAKGAFERTLAIGDSSDARAGAYLRAYLAGDRAEMMRHFDAGRRGREPWLLNAARARTLANEGQFVESSRFLAQSISEASAVDRAGAAAQGWLQLASISVQVGDDQKARKAAAEAIHLDHDARTVLRAAALLALAGDVPLAAALTQAFEADPPVDTITRNAVLTQARAAVAMGGHKLKEADQILDDAVSYEARYPELTWLRGLVRLQLRDRAAADSFRSLIEHPWRGGTIVYPLMELELARALAKGGDVQGARGAYEHFLNVWAAADPDLQPALDAKRELGTLAPH